MFTVEDFENLNGFGTRELERLAIILSVENWNPARADTFENSSEEKTITSSSEATRSASGIGSETDDDTTVSHFEEASSSSCMTEHHRGNVTSIAVENLLVQLGLIEYKEYTSFGLVSKFVKGFPLFQAALHHSCLGNRNIFETSLLIDNTLALCAGDRHAFMIEKEKKATTMILDARKSLGLEAPFKEDIPELLEDHDIEEDVSKTSKNERDRLLFQFVGESQEFSFMEQRMTFLGCSMESLRSSLAEFVQRNGELFKVDWAPRIALPSEYGYKEVSFPASESLCSCLGPFPFSGRLKTRYTQLRLLYELQRHLHRLNKHSDMAPSDMEAVALCIISFPSVHFEIINGSSGGNDEVQEVAGTVEACTVTLGPADGIKVASNEIRVLLAVPLSVAPIHVSLKLKKGLNDSVTISFVVAVEVEEAVFDWELWRTDYLDRLNAVRNFQKEHDLPFASLIRTEGKIDRGIGEARISGTGTGEVMKVWLGWLPPRPTMSLFELRTKGFVSKQDNVKYKLPVEWPGLVFEFGIGKERLLPSTYNAASKSDLEHASIVGCETLDIISVAAAVGTSVFAVDGNSIVSKYREISGNHQEGISDWEIRVHEAIAAHTNEIETLKTAVLSLCRYGRRSSSAYRAAQIIESFCSAFGKQAQVRSLGSPFLVFTDESIAEELFDLFQILMKKTDYSSIVAESMARVCSSLRNYQGIRYRKLTSVALEQTIVRSFWNRRLGSGRKLKPILGSILCRERLNNHALPLLLVCGGHPDRLNPTEWYKLGETQAFGRNNMLWPALSLELFSCGMFAARTTAYEQQLSVTAIESGVSYSSEEMERTLGNLRTRTAFTLSGHLWGVQTSLPVAVKLLADLQGQGHEGTAKFQSTKNTLPAVEQYTRAIGDGADTNAMIELANVLVHGGDGVGKDIPRAVELYSRAIDKGGHTTAMFKLANVLVQGGDGVGKNLPRAVELYTRAIEEGGHTDAMTKLANVLVHGSDGVGKDLRRAVELYTSAIDDGGDINAMIYLAILLQNGGDGVEKDVPRAVELYTRAIDEGGHTGAMNNLALLFENGGDGVEKDVPRAVELYIRAIDDGGDANAMNNLASLLENGGDGVEKDLRRAVELYTSAIDGGHTGAMNNLAIVLENGGDGVEKDVPHAVELYIRAIDEGSDTNAMFNLALVLENGGDGVEKDVPRAVELYIRAIDDGGDANAMNNLASLLENGGDGVEKDLRRAVELYTSAIDGGHTGAMNNLALVLENGGDGVEKDVPHAVELYARAIDIGGDINAMIYLAILLQNGGDGVEKDVPRAVELYTRAIDEGGHTGAMNNLANLLRNGGDGVEKDVPRAVELYTRAIDIVGDTNAMFNLALVLENGGDGVEKDVPRSVELYARSIDEGADTGAMNNLANLLRNGGDGVEKDVPRAVKLYTKAIDIVGDTNAMFNLALVFENGGDGVEKDVRRAVELYTKAVDEGGHTGAMNNLANILRNGEDGVEKDIPRAVKLYTRALNEGGITGALVNLSTLLKK